MKTNRNGTVANEKDEYEKRMKDMRIYLGGAMFSKADCLYNLRLANKFREKGFEVYCPNENKSINDKTRTDITAEKIYDSDLKELMNSNVFLCQISEDSGTMWEAGMMAVFSKYEPEKYYGVIGLTTDIRLMTPPDVSKTGVDNQCMYINQFVVGGLKESLGIFTDEDELIARLLLLQREKEL